MRIRNSILIIYLLTPYAVQSDQEHVPDLIYPPPTQAQPSSKIANCQKIIKDIKFFDKDGILRRGGLAVVNSDVAELRDIFKDIKRYNQSAKKTDQFLITSILPVSHPSIGWSDDKSMQLDNTSCYNYREKTDKPGDLSLHAVGRACDINPKCNPWVKCKHDSEHQTDCLYSVDPKDGNFDNSKGSMDTTKSCAISCDTPGGRAVLYAFLSRGWEWGGAWQKTVKEPVKDFQHFEKVGVGAQKPVSPFCGSQPAPRLPVATSYFNTKEECQKFVSTHYYPDSK